MDYAFVTDFMNNVDSALEVAIALARTTETRPIHLACSNKQPGAPYRMYTAIHKFWAPLEEAYSSPVRYPPLHIHPSERRISQAGQRR